MLHVEKVDLLGNVRTVRERVAKDLHEFVVVQVAERLQEGTLLFVGQHPDVPFKNGAGAASHCFSLSRAEMPNDGIEPPILIVVSESEDFPRDGVDLFGGHLSVPFGDASGPGRLGFCGSQVHRDQHRDQRGERQAARSG